MFYLSGSHDKVRLSLVFLVSMNFRSMRQNFLNFTFIFDPDCGPCELWMKTGHRLPAVNNWHRQLATLAFDVIKSSTTKLTHFARSAIVVAPIKIIAARPGQRWISWGAVVYSWSKKNYMWWKMTRISVCTNVELRGLGFLVEMRISKLQSAKIDMYV